jgi:phosphatidylserine/phosphatidylglycerophosphate/cardiolipin synthase-like enzyme
MARPVAAVAPARTRSRPAMIGRAMIVAMMATIGCARLFPASSETADESSPAAQLGAYQPGMDLRETFESLSGTAHPARIELLDDNLAAWIARWRMLSAARQSIDVNYFIFSQDVFGMAFLGHLVEKARQGVRVRIQLDAQGMRMAKQPHQLDCFAFLAGTANASIRIHRSLGRRFLEALARFDPILATASDHDKIIIVDRRMGVVGGRNIEAKYFAHPDDLADAFYDVDVVLDGSGVGSALTAVFETTYESDRVSAMSPSARDADRCAAAVRQAYEAMDAWLDGRSLSDEVRRPSEPQGVSWAAELARFPRLRGARARAQRDRPLTAETRVLDSVPRAGSPADPVTQSLTRLFQAASRTIVMESPYLVLTQDAAKMLEATGRRGVEMTLLTNSPASTDNALSQIYFGEQWPRLLAQVPQLRLFAAGTRHNIHSKYVIFDDQVVLLGSYNLDPFSMLVSGEIMVAVWSRRLAEQLAARPRAMIAMGAPVVHQYTIERAANGEPVRTATGEPVIAFGPADHTDAAELPRRGVRWTLVRTVPWLAGLPPFF